MKFNGNGHHSTKTVASVRNGEPGGRKPRADVASVVRVDIDGVGEKHFAKSRNSRPNQKREYGVLADRVYGGGGMRRTGIVHFHA